ncbi:putative transposaseS891/IS1136/IS1341 family protein [Leptolyngbya sp. NIES-3755]|nr:putative transposaseS891/IS1136/IS1341 family protein [Leptolyngbya sp. NIES-3755]
MYNAAVYNRKTQYQKLGKSVDYFEQQNSLPAFKEVWTEYKELGSQALQATLKRVDFAFQRFFKGLGGYPKFKSIRHYSGWTYPAKPGWKAPITGDNAYLELSNLGWIQMRGKPRTWGTPNTCTICYRNGKWYASITVQCQPERELGQGVIGADFGCKTAVALSDGTKIEAPKFLATAQKQIRKLSKQLRRKRKPEKRKIKASRRWKATQRKISKVKRKAANQRQDWVHQVATDITRCHSIVVTEKINLKGMTRKAKTGKRKRQKSGLNRSLLDVGIGMLKSAIEYKLVEGNGFYVEAPTRELKPTQRCAKCWKLTPKTLSDRMHVCSNPNCGHIEDRDVNSAQVCEIWVRSHELASLVADGSSSTSCGSMKQLAQAKRQKPRPS